MVNPSPLHPHSPVNNPKPLPPPLAPRPPDIKKRQWDDHVIRVITHARSAQLLQHIPSHALDHMRAVLLGQVGEASIALSALDVLEVVAMGLKTGAIISQKFTVGGGAPQTLAALVDDVLIQAGRK